MSGNQSSEYTLEKFSNSSNNFSGKEIKPILQLSSQRKF